MSSVALKLGHLNDFETHSPGCWRVPPKSNSREPPKNSEVLSNKEIGKESARRREDGQKVGADYAETKTVKVMLDDCLACSGCVSTGNNAAAPMLPNQSEQFLLNLKKGKAVIISISPQSMTSFAAHFSLSLLQAFRKLTTFFKSLGVKAVFDTSYGRDLALKEACDEFVARYKQSQSIDGRKGVPMISSACPGWISYAEEHLRSDNLSFISSVKSPQQTIGAIIKQYLWQKMSIRLDEVYHVTVMPCHEKKVEASRDQFVFQTEYQDGDQISGKLRVAEVDCVLTSSEVLQLIQSKSVDFTMLDESSVDRTLTNVSDDGHLCVVNGSSGGYAETILRHAAQALFGRNLEGPLEFKKLKTDLHEVCLEVDGETVLRFALCYGTKNLKTFTQNINRGKCNYHFLEIMTCPSGCLYGSGQIGRRPGQSLEDFMLLVNNAYMEDVLVVNPLQNPLVGRLYDEWLDEPGSEKSKRYIHTSYHPVDKTKWKTKSTGW